MRAEGLLAKETRPRAFKGRRGHGAILRGVNTNADRDPEDMVAIRLWCDGKRLISMRQRRLKTPRDVLAELEQGIGPRTAAELFERLIGRLIERMDDVIGSYDEALDGIEQQIESGDPSRLRHVLSELRLRIVAVRRYMAPNARR